MENMRQLINKIRSMTASGKADKPVTISTVVIFNYFKMLDKQADKGVRK